MDASIHNRAMLAKLSVSLWTARRYDKKASQEVSQQHGTKDDVGRYNKHLLGGKDASAKHQAVVSVASAARVAHYENTLPWADEGWRILPTANWTEYAEKIRKAKVEFDNAARAFVDDYPNLKAQAKSLLNGLYREEDYPTPEKVATLFACDVDYTPIPMRGDLRVALPQAEVEKIEADVEARVQRATADAMKDAWRRLQEVVSKVRERLADPEAIFRDSLIGNVSDCVDVLRRLNLTDDPDLEAARAKVELELADLSPKDLRENKGYREIIAKKAETILATMSSIYGAQSA